MVRRVVRWIRSHKLLTCCILVVTLALALNVIAYLQARSMTRFVRQGTRTSSPEQLGLASKLRVMFTGVIVPRPMNTRTPLDVGLPFTTHRTRSSTGPNSNCGTFPRAETIARS